MFPKTVENEQMMKAMDKYKVPMAKDLTKREHFASMALQGLLSMYDSEVGIVPNDSNSEYMARVAVKAADHLIAALNKEETK